VQFYYHYMMPSVFLLAALALALSDLRATRLRWLAYAIPAASVLLFALFFKVLTAAPLEGPMSFAKWTWLVGWR
jgi:hypothetical protein